MCPLGELVRRIDRFLVLLVVAHCGSMVLMRVGRHTLIDVVGHQDVTGQLNIVVSELANFNIVNAENFLLLAGTELEDGQELANAIKAAEDDASSNEGVEATGEGISKLVAHLDPVSVQPATGNDGIAIKMRYVVRGEEARQDVANEAANTMNGKDVQSIVAAEEVLKLRSVVTGNASADSKDDSRPGWDVTRSRSNGDKASNNSRAESNSGPLAFQTVINQAPSDTANAGSKVGDNGCHDGPEVGSES